MASLTEQEQWDDELYQLETTDPVVGGPNGISNQQAKTLGNRTKYLKALILNAIGNDEDFATTIANALSQKVAITDLQKGTHITAVDTGAANAYVVALSPAVEGLTDGMEISFTPANSNSGASTIAVNGLGPVSIVGSALSALQGGEIVTSGRVKLKYNSTISSFVIISTTGANQIANASKSNHAVALNQLFGGLKGIQKFTASDSFTVPDNVTEIYITAAGGGGGGGGGYTSSFSGQGGGSGATVLRASYAVTSGESIPITIGAGGSGGAIAAAGGNGGSTIIGLLITLGGGGGGNPGNASSGGNTAGGAGGDGAEAGCDAFGGIPGDGGANPIGIPGARRTASGLDGGNGAGGSGGYINGTGGNGGDGIVIIEW